jgi:hypothetical protein
MRLRIKTVWFKKGEGPREDDQTGSVIAANIWKISDQVVTRLSKADYDIITPQRGFKIIGETIAFLLHISDRMIYERVDEERRASLIQFTAGRLAEIMEQNIHDLLGDFDHPYQETFLDFLNRRNEDYATFDFVPEKPDFSVFRYFGNAIREDLEKQDQPWIVDQLTEIDGPDAVETLVKVINGLFKEED